MKHYTLAWRKVAAAFLSTLLALNVAYPVVPAYAEEETTTLETPAADTNLQTLPDQKNPTDSSPDNETKNGGDSAAPKETPSTQGEDASNGKQGDANESSSLSIMSASLDSTTDGNQSSTTDNSNTSNVTAQNDQAAEIKVSVAVIGPDADGKDVYWLQPTYMTVKAGSTAWDAVKPVLDNSGLAWNWSDSQWGISFNTITSPYTQAVLGWDANTGKYWQLFINDAASQVGVSSTTVADGDRIVYYYSGWGSEAAKNTSAAEYDAPNAEVANLPSDWSQSESNGNVTSAATPTTKTSVVWKTLVGGNFASVSEPLLVNGKVYLAVGSGAKSGYDGKLIRIDTATGKVETTGDLAGGIDYTVRPLYQDGIVYVPLKSGVVQAFNASTMKTRWVSESRDAGEQNSCSLRIENGTLYVGTGVSNYPNYPAYSSGSISALNAATGNTLWTSHNSSAGYYWTAPICINGHLYIGDAAGVMHVFDAATGTEQSTLPLGSAVNADPVLYKDSLLIVTRNGTLHRLAVGSNGSLSSASTIKALGGAKAAPAIVGNTALLVGCTTSDNRGALAIINLDSMTVTRTVTKVDGALFAQYDTIATSPLISTQGDGTWAYFARSNADNPSSDWTSYANGGDVYAYRLGDEEAHALYAPDSTVAQYCDSPVIADAKGNLYYLNDSGYLVQLKAREVTKNESKPSSGKASNGTSSSTTSAVDTTKQASASSVTHHTGQRPLTSRHTNASTTPTASTSTTDTQQNETSASSSSQTGAGKSSETDGAAAEVATEAKPTEAAKRQIQIPLWPIVGIICGAALLIWLFASRHRKDKKAA